MHLEDKIYRRAQRETFKYRRQSEDTYIIAQGLLMVYKDIVISLSYSHGSNQLSKEEITKRSSKKPYESTQMQQ